MTKKKRNHPDADEILSRPWCYYCERDFDDLKILINHQKAKHFKCERCGRRLNTAGGLSVHMSQVHKENLTAVDNALPNRAGLDIEIFGMEGIPEDIVIQHNQRVLTQFHQAEAERRANTGNTGPGSANGNGVKKPKTEDISDLKKRLAEHKAAKLAAEQNGGSSGSATPVGASQSQPLPPQTTYQTANPGYQQYPQPYAPPPSTASYGQPLPYSAPPTHTNFPAPGYGQSASPVYGQPPVQQAFPQPPYGQPPQPGFPPQAPFASQPGFSPPPFQGPVPYPGQPFSPPAPQNGPVSFPPLPPGLPRPFGGSPVPHHNQQQRTQSPAQNGLPQRTSSGSLPPAPGLPQRPAFGAPPVNAFQFQQMHQGQIPPPHNHLSSPTQTGVPPGLPANAALAPPPGVQQAQPIAASIDDLISSASKQADANAASTTVEADAAPAGESVPEPVAAPQEVVKEVAGDDKASKKEKEKQKQIRLVYSDNEVSPEEKMALMPKYAFTPQTSVTV